MTPWDKPDKELCITDIVEKGGRVTARVTGNAGIDIIEADTQEGSCCYYDLLGRPSTASTPGLYIRKSTSGKSTLTRSPAH